MESYAYAAPSSVSETVALLAQNASEGRQTQILAGGTDVLVQMRSSGHTPRTIVDIKRWQKPIGWMSAQMVFISEQQCPAQ